MKIKFITNACCIYEQQGYQLLADPWLVRGAFGTWVHDPALKTKPEDVRHVDALYISHIHPDHFCPETLKVFPRDIPIFILNAKMPILFKKLKDLGFTRIIEMSHGMLHGFWLFLLTIFEPFVKHPFHESEIGNVVDSALLIRAGGLSVLNTNDNTMSVEKALAFKAEYGSPTVAQLNFNCAGPYPACFDNLSREEKLLEHNRLIIRNLEHMRDVALALEPKYVMPFAGAYKLGYGLEHLNEYLGTTTAKHACGYLEEHGINAVYLEEGQEFDLS